ncbi:17785_t:CDS:2 [Cetraspora pellucida]|uniref:17785_t:CDS:1 n=1 Tax=Cetraspora pellucida TaxID=1433469 RepID=A0A9N9ADH6_9GLOM|nr:17785_t:CDS:2 [Cetraspora pellucida]
MMNEGVALVDEDKNIIHTYFAGCLLWVGGHGQWIRVFIASDD